MVRIFGGILFLLSFLSIGQAQDYYPWVPVDRNDILVTVRPRVEIEARLAMIRQAEHTIDIATFDQRADVVGYPILDALEEAAQRGVKVRFAMASQFMPANDSQGLVPKRLKSIVEKYPWFEYIFVGGWSMMYQTGWNFLDGIHEKLFIVDGKWGLTTGAGHAAQYLSWLDTGFLYKGNLVAQSTEVFNRLWETVLRENPTNGQTQRDLPPAQDLGQLSGMAQAHPLMEGYTSSNEASDVASSPLGAGDLEELQKILQWFTVPSAEGKDFRGRILHFDLMDQLRDLADKEHKAPKSYSLDERLDVLVDPVVNEVVDQLKTAKSFKLTTFSTIFHPLVKKALLARLSETSQLSDAKKEFMFSVFTNSMKTHEGIHPMQPTIGWYAGLRDLVDSLVPFQNAEGFLMETITPTDPVYLHRKMLILEQDQAVSGRQSSVIFGSHNLTYASSTLLDEVSLQVEGEDFVKQMTDVFKFSVLRNSEPVDKVALFRESHSLKSKTLEWLDSKLKWLY